MTTATPTTALTPEQDAVLAFARQTWRDPAARAGAIHDVFGWSETRYFQVLNYLLDQPGALVAEPALVNRLRAVRDRKRRERSATRLLMWRNRQAVAR